MSKGGKHNSHLSGSGYKILFSGYNGTIAPYTFTPENKLEPTGPVLNGSVGQGPSWISFSNQHSIIYVTDENAGKVHAVRVNGHEQGSHQHQRRTSNQETYLKAIDSAETGGSGPVSSVQVRNLLFVANYNNGSASVHDIKQDGTFRTDKPQQIWYFQREPAGSIGPISSRQDHSYAHEVAAEPTGRYVYVPDLGADRIHRLHIPSGATAKEVKLVGETQVPEGSGPRHISFYRKNDKTYGYLASELATTLTAFEVSEQDGSLNVIGQPQSALPQGISPGGNSTVGNERTTSEVAVSPDGRFVYVGTRHDSVEDHIAIFTRNEQDGSVQFQEWVQSGGRNLRHFSLSPDPEARFIIAAHQDTANATVLSRDSQTGKLEKTKATVQDIGQVAFAEFVTGPSHFD
ncbi:unnamed protein product [Sympodiomycopsis kandeliae]